MRAAATVAVLIAGWLVATAAVLALTEKAEAVIAIFPAGPRGGGLPQDVAMLSWNGSVGRFIGRDSGYVRSLYRAGAIFVLPARRRGCLVLPPAPRR